MSEQAAKRNRDVSKLPRWAQNEIRRLTANLDYAQKTLSAGPDNSDTFADPYSESKRPLGTGTMIEFGIERGKRFRVLYENGKLEVSADEGMVVEPRAANSVNLLPRHF